MNRLELCQRLVRESGLSSSGPTSTTNQSGDMLDVVNWIDEAYRRIQLEHSAWLFLRGEYSFNTVASTQEYDPSVEIGSFKKWVSNLTCYLASTGTSDEQYMILYDWDDFRRIYLFGSARTVEGRPLFYAIKPDKSVVFYPIPDDVYTITGEYWQVADTMSADADEPVFPEQYHLAVVWLALMFYGAKHSEPDKYAVGRDEYRVVLSQLREDQLESPRMGAPLV